MKIRITEACYIEGKKTGVGTERELPDSVARLLVNAGRALPVVTRVADQEDVPAEPSAQSEPRRKKDKR